MYHLIKTIFIIIFWPSLLLAAVCPEIIPQGDIVQCDSIEQYGITWTFSSPVYIGQFFNGDYFSVGSVVVGSVSPAPTGGLNGSMINPSTGLHAYDSRETTRYDASLLVTFPVTLNPGDSLISTKSLPAPNTGFVKWDGSLLHATLRLESSAVLTCLGTQPPANSFRPPFMGAEKPIYSAASLITTWLPDLATDEITLPTYGGFSSAIEYFERGLQRPWTAVAVTGDLQPRAVSPILNMFDYHRETGTFLGSVALYLTTNITGKDNLLKLFVQNGIDYFYTSKMGIVGTDCAFKISVIYAGLALNNPEMLNEFTTGESNMPWRDEDKIYYWESKTATTTSSIVPTGQTWTGETVFFRKQTDKFKPNEHEHLHPSEWPTKLSGEEICNGELYRQSSDSVEHMNMVLAAQIIENTHGYIKSLWNHDAAFSYLDRWKTENFVSSGDHATMKSESGCSVPASYGGMGAFGDSMYARYRNGASVFPPQTGAKRYQGYRLINAVD